MALTPITNKDALKQQQVAFTSAADPAGLHYLLHLPSAYVAGGERRWPLVLFLHGAGERGQDLRAVLTHGIPKKAEHEDFPFVALSPQCPASSWWTAMTGTLQAFLDEAIATYAVDATRVYLTGISMGGYGSWHLGAETPETFAAIVPICGGGRAEDGFPDRVLRLKDVPVWAFHGALDDVVPCRESQVLIDRLRGAGASPRFTVYPDAKHDSWTRTYDDPELYRWMLAQHR